MADSNDNESAVAAGVPMANVTRTIIILFVVVTLAAGFVLASEIVLILFLGVLFAVFLYHVAGWVERHTPLGHGGALAAVVTLLLLLMVGSTTFFFFQINEQIEQANTKIDEGISELRQMVEKYPSLRSAIGSVPILSQALERPSEKRSQDQRPVDDRGDADHANQDAAATGDSGEEKSAGSESEQPTMDLSSVPAPVQQAASTIGQLFRTTFGLVVNSLLIFFVGLFLAISPSTYRTGVIRLVPLDRRDRAGEVIDQVGRSLWRWLIGRFGSMLVTGVGAYLLLMMIGVPMAGTLGILTALLTFIPNIGAAIALMLAILFALPQGLAAAGMVLAAYMVLQLLESYLVTPLIQQHQVSLPPALLIAFQALMGVLFGFIGAAVASPLLAAGKTATEMLYIEDYLGEPRDN